MVTIKPSPKQGILLTKRTFLAFSLLFAVGVGYYWFALISSLLVNDISTHDVNKQENVRLLEERKEEQPLPRIRGVTHASWKSDSLNFDNIVDKTKANQSSLLKNKTKEILQQLTKENSFPVSSDDQRLSKYTSIIQKECLPGRDDAKGEINPTTHKNRECLRFVPKNNPKPRIGIMITPGFVSERLGLLISNALKEVSRRSGNEVEIVLTSHVPVYGYGKSHGYSKLIRVSLPLPLALGDAFLYEKSDNSSGSEPMLGKIGSPTKSELETLLKLIMRWQCRLSHVSAHTSMINVDYHSVLQDPLTSLEKIVNFVFANNWEWDAGRKKAWKQIDTELVVNDIIASKVSSDGKTYLDLVLDESKMIQDEVAKKFQESTSDAFSFTNTIQNAFEEEMNQSKDLTVWPCPSFWLGVEKLKFNSLLVPDCRDGHPWIKCTVNRDKCEVKEDPECK
ncbi:hypothetical protein HJC23_007732 [Cyclotella cryptica]|uniref:Uncharacterized protein n=1 Tax=Cyclotella cryptica TaxID=29204 RepID=A0ABD3P9J7_9STRA